jgi:hypothetical protein
MKGREMSEPGETVTDYTREYIRLRKETNRLLREGKIDKHEANHQNGNAKQFLMFARYQLKVAKKTSNLKNAVGAPQNWRPDSEDNWHAKAGNSRHR